MVQWWKRVFQSLEFKEGYKYMKAVVLCKYEGVYMLRHIIYDIESVDTINNVKDNLIFLKRDKF